MSQRRSAPSVRLCAHTPAGLCWDRLRGARLEAGLSVRQLAGRTGLSKSFVSDLERGRRRPTPRTVLLLAAALHLPDDLERELLTCALSRRRLRHIPLGVRPPSRLWRHRWRRWRRRGRRWRNRVVWRLRRVPELALLRLLAALQRRAGPQLGAWIAVFTTGRVRQRRHRRRRATRSRKQP